MTVFGAAEPMPIMRQFNGPVVTMDRVVDEGEHDALTGLWVGCPRKDVGWKDVTDPTKNTKSVAIAAEEERFMFLFATH